MTYQPKSTGKMADFETLYFPVFKSNVYLFLQGLSYKVLLVKNLTHLVAMGFTSRETLVYRKIQNPRPS